MKYKNSSFVIAKYQQSNKEHSYGYYREFDTSIIKKSPQSLSFMVIRKYSQQLIINADRQGASKSREYITFISGLFSAFLLRNRTPFLRADI
jgi:hypothetical protein